MLILLLATESGETMKAAGLKAIDTVVESTAVLVKSKTTTNQSLVDLIAARIRGVISKTLPLLFITTSTVVSLYLHASQPPKNTYYASTTFPGLNYRLPPE